MAVKQVGVGVWSLAAVLMAGCATDGERLAPIEAREVKRQVATVSGGELRPPVAPTPAVPVPSSPDAPKVMPLPESDVAAAPPVALPTPLEGPVSSAPVHGAQALSPGAPESAPSGGGEASSQAAQPDTRPAAVRQLLQEAEAARQAADLVRARAVLERGVKLAPREPEFWFRLAELAFAERDWEQSRSLAQRAFSLAKGDQALRERAQALELAAAAKNENGASR